MREIWINVGVNLGADGIMKALATKSQLYEVAHALLDNSNDGAEIYNVTIDYVIIEPGLPNQIEINFRFAWCIYIGRKKRNGSGIGEGCEIATYTKDGFLIFQVPGPRREQISAE